MHFKGRQVSDQVCLQPNELCIKPFSWFYITDQYGLPSTLVDGVLGLTQGYNLLGGYEPMNDYNPEESILEYLYLNGHITQIGFSTHFTGLFYDSYIDLGMPRPDAISSFRDTVTLKIPQGYFYTVEPEAVWFSNPEIGSTNSFYFAAKKVAILSTGLSYNLVPASYQ